VGLVLDTSVLIEAERGKLSLSSILRKTFPKESIYISSISVSELYLGAHFSQKSFKEQRTTSIEIMISSLIILDFDSMVARTHAHTCSQLKKKGIIIGPYDLIIAATCLYHQHSLLTFNIKEFSRVPNLKLASLD
jgi:predicted nucleic acid-binding protein